jgi:hypothetical protein
MASYTPTRTLLHTRHVVCTAHARSDGLFDVEATLRDISPDGTDLYFKRVEAGEAIHAMRLVVTFDADMTIVQARAITEATPTPWCAEGNGAYAALVGLKIGAGFTRRVRELLGGTKGCTHLTELLGPLATTALQSTFAVARANGGLKRLHAVEGPLAKPAIADTCHAYRSDGQAISVIWPQHRRPA